MNYGCFHCGEIDGEVYSDELDRLVCRVCHTRSIVDPVTALDILREVDINGYLPEHVQDYIDEADITEGE
jgi:hypothetical protein